MTLTYERVQLMMDSLDEYVHNMYNMIYPEVEGTSEEKRAVKDSICNMLVEKKLAADLRTAYGFWTRYRKSPTRALLYLIIGHYHPSEFIIGGMVHLLPITQNACLEYIDKTIKFYKKRPHSYYVSDYYLNRNQKKCKNFC